jgi:ABC-type Mn2+/Zn2+ transport system permease subunit
MNELAVLAGLLIAVTCGYLGVFVVLKRIAFVGVSLAQISSAGAALAFLVGPLVAGLAHQALPPHAHGGGGPGWMLLLELAAQRPLIVSMSITVLGACLYAQLGRAGSAPREAVIGIGYVVAAALTLLFIVRSPKGLDDVKELLDGSIIAVRASDLWVMAAVFGIAAAIHAAFYKQFLFVSFDPETAQTQGYRVALWETLFYAVMGLALAVAIHYGGVLSVFAYLVIPAVTGLALARSMRAAFVTAVAAAAVSTVAGFVGALKWDLPTSPPTIAALAIVLLCATAARRLVHRE